MAEPQPIRQSDILRRVVAKMINRQIEIDSEVSRIRAALVNSGQHTFEEAEKKLTCSKLRLFIGTDAARTPAGQAAFLTAVLTGARCFGEVTFHGHVHERLLTSLPIPAATLSEAAVLLGAHSANEDHIGRTVLIGSGLESVGKWSVQASWNGWIASISPADNQCDVGRGDCALAGVAAGATYPSGQLHG